MTLNKTAIISYFIDSLIISLIAIGGYVCSFIKPFERTFDVGDKTISFPYAIRETFRASHLWVKNYHYYHYYHYLDICSCRTILNSFNLFCNKWNEENALIYITSGTWTFFV